MDQGKATGSPAAEIVTHHSPLPWVTSDAGLRMMVRAADMTIVALRHRLPKDIHEENFEFIVRAVNNHEALVKALAGALAVIQDCAGYRHSGDPWEENAFDMGELDIHDYARDGRLEAARALLSSAAPPIQQAKSEVEG